MKHLIIYTTMLATCVVLGCTSEDSIKPRRPYVFVEAHGKQSKGSLSYPNLPKSLAGKSGHLTVYHGNGTNWIDATYVSGKPHGKVSMRSQDGKLFAVEHYDHGLRNGKLTWWHAGGEKYLEIDWVNGKKEGFWVEWDEGGVEKSRRQFKNDEPIDKNTEHPGAR